MMFCQLAKSQSLREICNGLRSFEGKLSHLGIEAPARSTLSYANEHRPWELFQDTFYVALGKCQEVAPGHRFRFKNKLFSVDATTITLCASMFDWARYKRKKGGIKVHLILDHDGYLPTYAAIGEARRYDITMARSMEFPPDSIIVFDRAYNDFRWFYDLTARGVFFVTRMKERTRYVVLECRKPPRHSTVLTDETIELIKDFDGVTPQRLRRVVVADPDGGEPYVFITNIFHLSARTVGEIFRDRWQIEKFFRALKQNLRIKTFVGTSENALHIQIWSALTAMLVLRYLMFKARYGWSLSNLVALLRHQLFVHRDLWSWLDDPFPPEPPDDQFQLAIG
jgi:hypothetical protein